MFICLKQNPLLTEENSIPLLTEENSIPLLTEGNSKSEYYED